MSVCPSFISSEILILLKLHKALSVCTGGIKNTHDNLLTCPFPACALPAGYGKGKTPADPCGPPPSPSSKKSAQTASIPPQQHSTLCMWLSILAQIASSGRTVAYSLFSLDILSLLKEIGRDFSAHVAIVQGVEAVCGELAWNCQVRVVWLWLES